MMTPLFQTKTWHQGETWNCPVDVVATVAAQLLEGENYGDAVRKAHGLILECYRQRDALAYYHPPKGQKVVEIIPGEKALKKITGQSDLEKATKYFRELRSRQHTRELEQFGERIQATGRDAEMLRRNGPKRIERKIEEEISQIKSTGVSPDEIDAFRAQYLREFPRRNPKPRKPRPKPRKK